MEGCSRTRAARTLVSAPPEALKMPARMAPRWRRWRVRARVSTPVMPATSCSASHCPKDALRSPTAGQRRQLAHHNAGEPRRVGLLVGRGDAVVADLRRGEGHDLPAVGGVGGDLLIPGHRCVEDDLPQARLLVAAAEGLAGEAAAVLEHQQGFVFGGHLLLRSHTCGDPVKDPARRASSACLAHHVSPGGQPRSSRSSSTSSRSRRPSQTAST